MAETAAGQQVSIEGRNTEESLGLKHIHFLLRLCSMKSVIFVSVDDFICYFWVSSHYILKTSELFNRGHRTAITKWFAKRLINIVAKVQEIYVAMIYEALIQDPLVISVGIRCCVYHCASVLLCREIHLPKSKRSITEKLCWISLNQTNKPSLVCRHSVDTSLYISCVQKNFETYLQTFITCLSTVTKSKMAERHHVHLCRCRTSERCAQLKAAITATIHWVYVWPKTKQKQLKKQSPIPRNQTKYKSFIKVFFPPQNCLPQVLCQILIILRKGWVPK